MDWLVKMADKMLGPIRFECNRRPIVAAMAAALMRGADPQAATETARQIGNEPLTQASIDRLIGTSPTPPAS